MAAALAMVLGVLFVAGMHWLAVDGPYAVMIVTLIFDAVNVMSYAGTGLMPLAARRPRLRGFFERNARRIAVIDMQVSMVSIVFLWVAAAGLV